MNGITSLCYMSLTSRHHMTGVNTSAPVYTAAHVGTAYPSKDTCEAPSQRFAAEVRSVLAAGNLLGTAWGPCLYIPKSPASLSPAPLFGPLAFCQAYPTAVLARNESTEPGVWRGLNAAFLACCEYRLFSLHPKAPYLKTAVVSRP